MPPPACLAQATAANSKFDETLEFDVRRPPVSAFDSSRTLKVLLAGSPCESAFGTSTTKSRRSVAHFMSVTGGLSCAAVVSLAIMLRLMGSESSRMARRPSARAALDAGAIRARPDTFGFDCHRFRIRIDPAQAC